MPGIEFRVECLQKLYLKYHLLTPVDIWMNDNMGEMRIALNSDSEKYDSLGCYYCSIVPYISG